MYVLVERIAVVHHSGDTTLRIAGATLGGVALGQNAHFAIGSHLEGETEAGDAGPNNQKVYFVAHD